MPRSLPQMAAALTLIKTSFGAILGTSISLTSTPSSGFVFMTAFMEPSEHCTESFLNAFVGTPHSTVRRRHAMLRDAERRALEALDVEGMVGCLCSLIEVPSVGGEETEAQRRVEAELRRLGLEVDAWEIDFDDARRHPSFSMGVDRREGIGL